jgi:hypothetical protein
MQQLGQKSKPSPYEPTASNGDKDYLSEDHQPKRQEQYDVEDAYDPYPGENEPEPKYQPRPVYDDYEEDDPLSGIPYAESTKYQDADKPTRRGPTSAQGQYEEDDPLSGIPYAESTKYQDQPRSGPRSPEEREFPLDDSNGNLGVGYEDLEEVEEPEPQPEPVVPATKGKGKKKLYGAPSRPKVPPPPDKEYDGPELT